MNDLDELKAEWFEFGRQSGKKEEKERIIKMIEGWCYPKYIGTPPSTPEEIELLEDLIHAINEETK